MTVGEIRHAIYLRQDGHCIACPTVFTEKQMHMHEKVFRGKGGKISLENSEGLCYSCHIDNKSFGHGKRKPQFSKKVLDTIPESE